MPPRLQGLARSGMRRPTGRHWCRWRRSPPLQDDVGLGTSVLQWTRSLPNMELAAANIHELSEAGSRSVSAPCHVSGTNGGHGIAYERPLQRMREYVEALRISVDGEHRKACGLQR